MGDTTRAARRQASLAGSRFYVTPTQARLDALVEAVKNLGTKYEDPEAAKAAKPRVSRGSKD